jgi:hypothetical protein
MKLTDTQLVLLPAAAQRQDGAVELGSKLKGASQKVIGKLLSEHLIEEIPAGGALPVWRRDDEQGALALRITDHGLAAIGANHHDANPDAGVRQPEQAAKRPSGRTPRRAAARRKQTNETLRKPNKASRAESKQAMVIAKPSDVMAACAAASASGSVRSRISSRTGFNKLGVRYRYYVSHALLQSRRGEAGSVARVPAPEIEQLVLDGIRARLVSTELPVPVTDRDLIERHVQRVVVGAQAVEVHLSHRSTEPAEAGDDELAAAAPAAIMLTLPWAAPSFVAVKGIVHQPAAKPTMTPEARDVLLAAVAKARGWIEDLRLGRVATLAEIAGREGLGERHVRLLAPLAFVSPGIIVAIADGSADVR